MPKVIGERSLKPVYKATCFSEHCLVNCRTYLPNSLTISNLVCPATGWLHLVCSFDGRNRKNLPYLTLPKAQQMAQTIPLFQVAFVPLLSRLKRSSTSMDGRFRPFFGLKRIWCSQCGILRIPRTDVVAATEDGVSKLRAVHSAIVAGRCSCLNFRFNTVFGTYIDAHFPQIC